MLLERKIPKRVNGRLIWRRKRRMMARHQSGKVRPLNDSHATKDGENELQDQISKNDKAVIL